MPDLAAPPAGRLVSLAFDLPDLLAGLSAVARAVTPTTLALWCPVNTILR